MDFDFQLQRTVTTLLYFVVFEGLAKIKKNKKSIQKKIESQVILVEGRPTMLWYFYECCWGKMRSLYLVAARSRCLPFDT